MIVARLAQRHKRALDWEKAIAELVQDPKIADEMHLRLKEYRSLLNACWENSAINAADENRLVDLERRLNALSEEGRLRVIGGAYVKNTCESSH